jgi:hypothetical protein
MRLTSFEKGKVSGTKTKDDGACGKGEAGNTDMDMDKVGAIHH